MISAGLRCFLIFCSILLQGNLWIVRTYKYSFVHWCLQSAGQNGKAVRGTDNVGDFFGHFEVSAGLYGQCVVMKNVLLKNCW